MAPGVLNQPAVCAPPPQGYPASTAQVSHIASPPGGFQNGPILVYPSRGLPPAGYAPPATYPPPSAAYPPPSAGYPPPSAGYPPPPAGCAPPAGQPCEFSQYPPPSGKVQESGEEAEKGEEEKPCCCCFPPFTWCCCCMTCCKCLVYTPIAICRLLEALVQASNNN